MDKELRALHAAVTNLMNIVEGCRRQRWAAGGRRLVDTPEWTDLYSLWCRANEAKSKHNAKIAEIGLTDPKP